MLYGLIGGGLAVALFGFLVYRTGKRVQKGKTDAKNAETQQKYADIAVNKPDRADVVDSLRDGKF